MASIRYRFGDCSVDPAARDLRRAGELVVLSPKVFDCIAYLIEHRDRAVGRDELIAAVWGRVNVTDALLGQAMLKARRAVGDTGEEQNAIRTIPRFGYRWVAEVAIEERAEPTRNTDADGSSAPAVDMPAASNDFAPAPQRNTPVAHRRSIVAWIVGACVACALGIFAFVFDRPAPPPPTFAQSGKADVIAVLPVVVEAGAEWSWLRLGMMDLVAARLRRAGLNVVPSDNVVALARNSGDDITRVAQEIRTTTGAQRLLSPKAMRTATGWRVHFDLDGADGDIEIEAQNIDAVAATRAAVEQLLVRLGHASAPEAVAEEPSRDEIQQRAVAAMLTDDLEGARRIIESAPAELRNAPELRLRMAQVELRGGQIAAARARIDALLGEIGAEADPVLRARAFTIASSIAIHQGDIARATQTCDEAIGLLERRSEPAASGRAYAACGVADATAGRFDDAMNRFAQARVAFEITGDVLSLARIEANEGRMELMRGHYAEGAAIMRRSEERFQRLGGYTEVLQAIGDEAAAHLALLQPVEALAASERGMALLPRIANGDMRRGLQVQHARALAANGRLGEAAALLTTITGEVIAGQESEVLGQARATQAHIELATGRAPTAIEHARVAIAALGEPDDARERALAWRTLVRALHATGADADANAEATRFSAWATGSSIAAVPTYAALAEAELFTATRRDDAYERALASAEHSGVPIDVAAVAISWGDVLIDSGDLQRAAAVIGRVARWADADFDSSVAQTRLYRALGREDAWRAAAQRARSLAGERGLPPYVSAPDMATPPNVESSR